MNKELSQEDVSEFLGKIEAPVAAEADQGHPKGLFRRVGADSRQMAILADFAGFEIGGCNMVADVDLGNY